MPTVRTVANELTDLIDATRTMIKQADAANLTSTAHQLRGIAYKLDAVRTRLVQDGDTYIDVASAFISAATEYLPAHAAHIGRARHINLVAVS